MSKSKVGAAVQYFPIYGYIRHFIPVADEENIKEKLQ